jgi:hypothetical protein
MRAVRAAIGTLAVAAGSMGAAACSAAPPPAKAPAAVEAAPGQHPAPDGYALAGGIDGAVTDLARAEDEMQRALALAGGAPRGPMVPGTPPQPSPGAAAGAPAPPPAPPAADEPSKSPASKRSEEEGAGELSAADACSVACRALESMRRSTEQLCGLAGAGDARCVDANARVDRAVARVRASCPACAR